MAYEKVIFNENALKGVVKATAKAELEKQLKDIKFEMKRMWDFINKLREEIKVM